MKKWQNQVRKMEKHSKKGNWKDKKENCFIIYITKREDKKKRPAFAYQGKQKRGKRKEHLKKAPGSYFQKKVRARKKN